MQPKFDAGLKYEEALEYEVYVERGVVKPTLTPQELLRFLDRSLITEVRLVCVCVCLFHRNEKRRAGVLGSFSCLSSAGRVSSLWIAGTSHAARTVEYVV